MTSVNGNPMGRIEASIETKLIYERLKETQPGDDVSYDELSKLIGIPVTEGRGNGYLRSARNMVGNNEGFVIITIRAVGIRHATDEEVVDDIGKDVPRMRRIATKASRKPAGIKDYESLSSDVKIRHNMYLSLVGAIKQATSSGSKKRIMAAVADGHQALPVAKTLELFSG